MILFAVNAASLYRARAASMRIRRPTATIMMILNDFRHLFPISPRHIRKKTNHKNTY